LFSRLLSVGRQPTSIDSGEYRLQSTKGAQLFEAR
jgi:hypothetical protein